MYSNKCIQDESECMDRGHSVYENHRSLFGASSNNTSLDCVCVSVRFSANPAQTFTLQLDYIYTTNSSL